LLSGLLDMTLVNYAYHTSVTDSKDWLLKLRTFAVAQGWTGSDYRTSVEWSGGWVAGAGDFLQLVSTCYGSCDKANYRFYASNLSTDRDQVDHSAHTTDVYTNQPTSPLVQDRWSATTEYHGTSMPSTAQGIDKAWFFGGQEYIYAVCQYDDYVVPTWHLGTIDLYTEYQSRADCAFWGAPNYQNGSTFYWDLMDGGYWRAGLLPSWDTSSGNSHYDCVYFSGQEQNRTQEGASYTWWQQTDISGTPEQEEGGAYNWCKNVARTTGYSAKRIGFKVDFCAQDVAGGGDIVPLGKTPFYVIPFDGLATGESITEAGKTYLCFPFRFTWHNLGFAFRIA
jgi:hypothetical protein